MSHSRFHIITGLFLGLLLLFGGTAKEALHAFAPHSDTVHCHSTDALHFDEEHHHCGALSVFVAPFIDASEPFFLQIKEPIQNSSYVRHFCALVLSAEPSESHLRGPPVA